MLFFVVFGVFSFVWFSIFLSLFILRRRVFPLNGRPFFSFLLAIIILISWLATCLTLPLWDPTYEYLIIISGLFILIHLASMLAICLQINFVFQVSAEKVAQRQRTSPTSTYHIASNPNHSSGSIVHLAVPVLPAPTEHQSDPSLNSTTLVEVSVSVLAEINQLDTKHQVMRANNKMLSWYKNRMNPRNWLLLKLFLVLYVTIVVFSLVLIQYYSDILWAK